MEVFSILAPLMEGTEGLKKAEEALNLAKIGAMFDLMRGVLDLLLVISRQSAIKLTIYKKKLPRCVHVQPRGRRFQELSGEASRGAGIEGRACAEYGVRIHFSMQCKMALKQHCIDRR